MCRSHCKLVEIEVVADVVDCSIMIDVSISRSSDRVITQNEILFACF